MTIRCIRCGQAFTTGVALDAHRRYHIGSKCIDPATAARLDGSRIFTPAGKEPGGNPVWAKTWPQTGAPL